MMNWEKYGIQVSPGARGKRKMRCPQCSDRRTDKRDKSLSVDLDTGLFHCHYCQWSGCAKEGTEAMWQRPEPIAAREYVKPAPRAYSGFSDKLTQYFKARGISEATLTAAKVGEGMEWMPQDGAERNCIHFNYYRRGELVNVKYRTGDKHFKLVSGAELVPYLIDNIAGTPECIITEGEFDALSFIEAGRTDVVSVPNGANSNLSYLDECYDLFADKQTIYIAVDTDTKGIALRDELVRRFGAAVCRIVTYGHDCKDANELLVRRGAQALTEALSAAADVKVDGVFKVSDFEDALDAVYENGLQRGLTIGHPQFDELISLETKRLCLVTGVPGSGKSEFIDEMAERLNMRYGWKWGYFSPENMPLHYHGVKIIEKLTGKRCSRSTLTLSDYRAAKSYMDENFFFIMPERYTLDAILDKAQFLVRRRGIKALVLDPYNRIETDMGQASETQNVSKVLDRLQDFAQREDVLVILMAHPAKMQRDPKTKEYDMPTLYDISGSAHFYNKADFGIVVHRQRQIVRVKVAKVKFRHLGQPGEAYFRYNAANGRYTPVDDELDSQWEHDYSNHLTSGLPQTAPMERMRNADTGTDIDRLFAIGDDDGAMPF